jgi:hypothetical protein
MTSGNDTRSTVCIDMQQTGTTIGSKNVIGPNGDIPTRTESNAFNMRD